MTRVYYFCRYCGGEFFAREFWKHCAGCAKNPKNADPTDTTTKWKKLMGNSIRSQRVNKLKRYGLTLERYDEILAGQGGGCAICGKRPGAEGCHPNQQFLAVDHNHVTNQVRGLLCSNCNHMIGKSKESIANLEAGIAYLRLWGHRAEL